MSCKLKLSCLLENNNETLKKYVCPKCDHLLLDAVQTSCGHWLCAECAALMTRKKTPGFVAQDTEERPIALYCPREDCSEELTYEDGRLFFPDRFVRKTINCFATVCPNQKFGCSWKGSVGEVSHHLSNCVHEKQECPHCNEAFTITEYQLHADNCPKAMVFCPLKNYGCKKTDKMSREECTAHLTSKQGSYTHILLIAAALSAIQGYSGDLRPTLRPMDDEATGGAMEGFGMSEEQLMSFITGKLAELQAEFAEKDSMIHVLQNKVTQLETLLLAMPSENEELNQSTLMENSNFDGSMVWKIPQFSQRMDDARTGKHTSIFSLPFYSSRYGYKMCLRLYILGDGIGKGTHMSLFFVVMKGEFDNILQWPFTHKVTFKLINQCGSRDIMDIFQPDPLSSSFQKPKSDMNVASGCPHFVSMNELMQGGFIVDDTIFIKVKVDVPND